MKVILYTLLLTVGISSCQNRALQEEAEILYFGGSILTMENRVSQVEAIASKNGKILFTGTKLEANRYSEPATKCLIIMEKHDQRWF